MILIIVNSPGSESVLIMTDSIVKGTTQRPEIVLTHVNVRRIIIASAFKV